MPKNAGAGATTLEAQDAGVPNLAIFEHFQGADTVARFADSDSAKLHLKNLPPDLAANSFVVDIRSWCQGIKYFGVQKILGGSSVPVFKCAAPDSGSPQPK